MWLYLLEWQNQLKNTWHFIKNILILIMKKLYGLGKKNDMKNEKTEPWNDQSAPISKNGAKWVLIIGIGIVFLVCIGMMIFAYFANN